MDNLFRNLIHDLFGQFPHEEKERRFGKLTTEVAQLSDEYRETWNVHNAETYFYLCKDGVRISDDLYREGGLGKMCDAKDYLLLLKYKEALYPENITTDSKDKRHLEGRWCILDKEGNIKVEFSSFKPPYLQGGVLYSLDQKYYNIETGEEYCSAYTTMHTDEYVFLDNAYDKDLKKRGVLQINKSDGTYVVWPKK